MTIRSMTVLIITCFFLSAFLAACATAQGANPHDKPLSLVPARPATHDTYTATEEWEGTRAAYERDLDYSTIEESGEYDSKRALVEAKYFLDLALMDLKYNRDKSIAVKDLDNALSWLQSSLAASGQDDN